MAWDTLHVLSGFGVIVNEARSMPNPTVAQKHPESGFRTGAFLLRALALPRQQISVQVRLYRMTVLHAVNMHEHPLAGTFTRYTMNSRLGMDGFVSRESAAQCP